MAIYRKIHLSFWSDTFIQDLDSEHKLFYLYLLTNANTKQCGVYEISKRQISFDLGCSIDRVSILLKYFSDMGRIMYSPETNEIALKNWMKYNGSTSPKVVKCINTELKEVKNTLLIQYVNGTYTSSQEEPEEEQKPEEEPEYTPPTPSRGDLLDADFIEFWNLYDKKRDKDKCQKKWKRLTRDEKQAIFETLPKYVASTPDKGYRKNPLTWLNGKCWEDEIIEKKTDIRNASALDQLSYMEQVINGQKTIE